jgi:hypothetical protein
MVGGLIQLVTYGTQDIFLTGTPQITFFKFIYRRHTNFSIESIEQTFNGNIDFGSEVVSHLDKNGDLIHKTYLELTLPHVQLEKTDLNPNYGSPLSVDFTKTFRPDDEEYFEKTLALTDHQATFYTFKVFIEYIMPIYRDTVISVEQGADLDVETDVNDQFPEGSFPNEIVDKFTIPVRMNFNIRKLLIEYYQDRLGINSPEFEDSNSDSLSYKTFTILIIPAIYSNHFVKLPDIFSCSLYLDELLDNFFRVTVKELFDEEEQEIAILVLLNEWLLNSQIMYNTMYDRLKIAQHDFDVISSPYVKFAWIKRIGHYIAAEIELQIGGKRIDRHYRDWLNIWYELSHNVYMENVYNKMIGDVDILTTFDNELKPIYKLYIPLQFSFCRHGGLALPLVALRYHDVDINIRFSKIEECCYVEPGYSLFDSLHIEHASLYVDYIYLDSAERKRFAQASHEYLIEQLQIEEFKNITSPVFKEQITFDHPTKEIIWTVQANRHFTNPNDDNILFDKTNYSYSTLNKHNPIINTKIDFNTYPRVNELDGNYYNYVQPYQSHSHTPSPGINTYSFAFDPEKQQPSCSANLSRIKYILMTMTLDERIFNNFDEYSGNINGVIVTIYAINYNVLRFMSGMSGLAFSGN